jgi:hypothetical protein
MGRHAHVVWAGSSRARGRFGHGHARARNHSNGSVAARCHGCCRCCCCAWRPGWPVGCSFEFLGGFNGNTGWISQEGAPAFVRRDFIARVIAQARRGLGEGVEAAGRLAEGDGRKAR